MTSATDELKLCTTLEFFTLASSNNVLAVGMAFQPLNPHESVHVHRERLPHWRQWGTTYFVTARLADSIPTIAAENWRMKRDAWLRSHHLSSLGELESLPDAVRQEYHREFTGRFHELLDAGHGACYLSDPFSASLLVEKFIERDGADYHLDGWAIMPNHFHALVEPIGDAQLGNILQKWKGGSARTINQSLGRMGPLWQREFFDHIVRSEAQLDHFRRYIGANPEKAGLSKGYVLGVGVDASLSKAMIFDRLNIG
ncbi:transposase [Verrucomicrobium spinosum]|uniref:transposase n=1 Tax=Verrucomicrobium spinosum TaxID=2736 RepID=UPI001E339934|nr:transposase [Verrucomicrobium spinosum]